MRLKTAMVPPGGWHYEQETYRIEASGYVELVQAVQTWRLQNHRPVGQVEKDIEDFYCAKYPMTCHPIGGGQNVQVYDIPKSFGQKLVDEITIWAMGLYKDPRSKVLIGEHEAVRRANICAQCPMNKEWKGGCANCNNHAERLLTILRQGRDAGLSNQLQGCQTLKHCNRTAVWMPKELISSDGAPRNCWMTT